MDQDSVRSDFDRIAAVSSGSGSERYDSFLLSLVPPAARHVLDVGCGSGRLSLAVAEPNRDVLGIDLSPGMIARAEASAEGHDNVRFACADFLQWNPGSLQFDCVISSAAVHHMDGDAALRKMAGVLRPSGRLVLHDVRRADGAFDWLTSSVAYVAYALLNPRRSGIVGTRRAEAEAWRNHGAGEQYATTREMRRLALSTLGNGTVVHHPLWRYTLIWDKPAVADVPEIGLR